MYEPKYSLNLERRHLSAVQKAAVAVDMLPLLEREAKERMSLGGKGGTISDTLKARSTDQAAGVLHVSRNSVSDAKRICAEAPEVFALMREGLVSMPEANQTVTRV